MPPRAVCQNFRDSLPRESLSRLRRGRSWVHPCYEVTCGRLTNVVWRLLCGVRLAPDKFSFLRYRAFGEVAHRELTQHYFSDFSPRRCRFGTFSGFCGSGAEHPAVDVQPFPLGARCLLAAPVLRRLGGPAAKSAQSNLVAARIFHQMPKSVGERVNIGLAEPRHRFLDTFLDTPFKSSSRAFASSSGSDKTYAERISPVSSKVSVQMSPSPSCLNLRVNFTASAGVFVGVFDVMVSRLVSCCEVRAGAEAAASASR